MPARHCRDPLTICVFVAVLVGSLCDKAVANDVLLVSVPSTTPANDAYWQKECQRIPADSPYIKLVMGSITDYFRPSVDDAAVNRTRHSWCDMLLASNKHEWSNDGMDWKTPEYYTPSATAPYKNRRGGSSLEWPAQNVFGDYRKYLSFWGSPTTPSADSTDYFGGCCTNSKSYTTTSWKQAFTVYYANAIPNAISKVIVVAAAKTDAAYWGEKCKEVSNNAAYIVIAMGLIADYFRPVPGRSFCDMLQSNNLHEWSPDAGVTWLKPEPDAADYLGGSSYIWQRDQNPLHGRQTDYRYILSRWGSTLGYASYAGGCCSRTYTERSYTWSKAFVLWEALPSIAIAMLPSMHKIVAVAATEHVGLAFWQQACTQIPVNAAYIAVQMGRVVDYFRPQTGVSYCEMLQSNSKHQHTSDPNNIKMYPWKNINSGTVDGLGGSASSTPSAANPADKRDRLSMWGSKRATDLGGCCSKLITGSPTGYGIPFSMYYQGPPAPAEPVTARIPLVVVRPDSQTGAAFWKHECAKISDSATNLVVSAENVTDFFRPVPGATFCEMLTAGDKHLWSADGHAWYQPLYDLQNTAWYGGSAQGWLQTISPRDQRQHLSVWGSNSFSAEYSGGGCCSSSYDSADISTNQAFTIAFTHVRYTDLLVVDVASNQRANAAFWGTQCKQVPANAVSVRMDCGAVTDYFRPFDDVSWCTMLTSHENHEWSPSREAGSWIRPRYLSSRYFLGGSAHRWPRDNAGEGDERSYLNFWGGNFDGGYCAPSHTSSAMAARVKFAMTFQSVEHSTTTATTTTATETSSTVTSTTTTSLTATSITTTSITTTSITTTSITTTSITTITTITNATDAEPLGSSQLSTAALAATIAGGVLVFLLLLCVICMCYLGMEEEKGEVLEQNTVDMMINPMYNKKVVKQNVVHLPGVAKGRVPDNRVLASIPPLHGASANAAAASGTAPLSAAVSKGAKDADGYVADGYNAMHDADGALLGGIAYAMSSDTHDVGHEAEYATPDTYTTSDSTAPPTKAATTAAAAAASAAGPMYVVPSSMTIGNSVETYEVLQPGNGLALAPERTSIDGVAGGKAGADAKVATASPTTEEPAYVSLASMPTQNPKHVAQYELLDIGSLALPAPFEVSPIQPIKVDTLNNVRLLPQAGGVLGGAAKAENGGGERGGNGSDDAGGNLQAMPQQDVAAESAYASPIIPGLDAVESAYASPIIPGLDAVAKRDSVQQQQQQQQQQQHKAVRLADTTSNGKDNAPANVAIATATATATATAADAPLSLGGVPYEWTPVSGKAGKGRSGGGPAATVRQPPRQSRETTAEIAALLGAATEIMPSAGSVETPWGANQVERLSSDVGGGRKETQRKPPPARASTEPVYVARAAMDVTSETYAIMEPHDPADDALAPVLQPLEGSTSEVVIAQRMHQADTFGKGSPAERAQNAANC